MQIKSDSLFNSVLLFIESSSIFAQTYALSVPSSSAIVHLHDIWSRKGCIQTFCTNSGLTLTWQDLLLGVRSDEEFTSARINLKFE